MTVVFIVGIVAILSAPAIIWLKSRKRRHYIRLQPKVKGEK